MFAPDLLIQETLRDGLDFIQANPGTIDEIFAGLSEGKRTQIRAYALNIGPKAPQVRLGWVRDAAAMPCIAVTMPGEQETAQFVGSTPHWDVDTDADELIPPSFISDGAYYEAQVTQFSTEAHSAIYTLNPEETSWLTAMVKWILLRARDALQDAGMFEQKITATDFVVDLPYAPDLAYSRIVQLSAQTWLRYTNEYTGDGATDTATSVSVTLEEA